MDIPYFILAGESRIDPTIAAANAQMEFFSTVANAGINQYSPSLSNVDISGDTTVYCGSNAVMIWMLPGISSVSLTANSTAEARETQGSP